MDPADTPLEDKHEIVDGKVFYQLHELPAEQGPLREVFWDDLTTTEDCLGA